MRSRAAIALLSGLALLGVGASTWIADRRVLDAGVPVSGRFTGTHEVRDFLSMGLESSIMLHPRVEFTPLGGGRMVMVLEDEMQPGEFASAGEREFLYVPGDPPALRLPERLSRWGNPTIWWCLGLGAAMAGASLGALGRSRPA